MPEPAQKCGNNAISKQNCKMQAVGEFYRTAFMHANYVGLTTSL